MPEIVWPKEIEEAYRQSPEMVAMRQAFLNAFVAGVPVMVRLREDGDALEAIPIEDFWLP